MDVVVGYDNDVVYLEIVFVVFVVFCGCVSWFEDWGIYWDDFWRVVLILFFLGFCCYCYKCKCMVIGLLGSVCKYLWFFVYYYWLV